MLDPDFDSVGVGVTVNRDEANQTTLLLTMVFARMPPPEAAKLSEKEVLATFQELRRAKNLSPLHVDAGLAAAARIGSRAAAGVPDSTVQERLSRGTAATNRVLQLPVNRRPYSRRFCYGLADILERRQLESSIPLILDPVAQNIGIGTVELTSPSGPRLEVFLVVEGAAGKRLECR
jgi:hypothetical protein